VPSGVDACTANHDLGDVVAPGSLPQQLRKVAHDDTGAFATPSHATESTLGKTPLFPIRVRFHHSSGRAAIFKTRFQKKRPFIASLTLLLIACRGSRRLIFCFFVSVCNIQDWSNQHRGVLHGLDLRSCFLCVFPCLGLSSHVGVYCMLSIIRCCATFFSMPHV